MLFVFVFEILYSYHHHGYNFQEFLSLICDKVDHHLGLSIMPFKPAFHWNINLLQKFMNLKSLTLVQSKGCLGLKISSFGCNVARAFSRTCSIDIIFVHIWAKNWCPKIPTFQENSCKLHVTRSCVSATIQLINYLFSTTFAIFL